MSREERWLGGVSGGAESGRDATGRTVPRKKDMVDFDFDANPLAFDEGFRFLGNRTALATHTTGPQPATGGSESCADLLERFVASGLVIDENEVEVHRQAWHVLEEKVDRSAPLQGEGRFAENLRCHFEDQPDGCQSASAHLAETRDSNRCRIGAYRPSARLGSKASPELIKIAESRTSGQTQGVALADKIPWFNRVSREERWLVGVSGGADSVALLHLLVAEGFGNLVVCHLDHGLRGRASTDDAKFVRRLAENLGIICELGKVDVALRMAERGESLETSARHARHDFFGECGRKYDCLRVLLAHHADDQAETVLWNLLRGSHGLKGMQAARNITTGSGIVLELIRPLLGLRHAELIGWLREKKHRWREDASNAQPIAVRNRFRNEVLPLLTDISNREVVPALVRGAADAEDMTELVKWALKQAHVLDPQGRLHLPTLRCLPAALQQAALWKFLLDHDVVSVDRPLIERALGLLDVKNPSSINLPGGTRLRRQAGRLLIS